MPDAWATAIATGTIMLADAVFDAASDITIATAVKRIVSDNVERTGSHAVIP